MGLVGVTMADIAGQHNFLCKGTQPDTACHFTLNCGLQAAPRIYSELVHYTFGIHQGRAPAQTDVHTTERKDSVPMMQSQDLRGPLCAHHMGIKLHLLLGESVLPEMLKE